MGPGSRLKRRLRGPRALPSLCPKDVRLPGLTQVPQPPETELLLKRVNSHRLTSKGFKQSVDRDVDLMSPRVAA